MISYEAMDSLGANNSKLGKILTIWLNVTDVPLLITSIDGS